MVLLVAIGILILAAVVSITVTNGMSRKKLQAENAYSQIDVQLRRKLSLIPNLVEAVKGYVKHEHDVLVQVAQARAAVLGARGPADAARANHMLTGSLSTLFGMVQEQYPQLKADQQFKGLQEELVSTENRVTYARQAYNDAVTVYNIAVVTFPGSLFAGPKFPRMELFDVPEETRQQADNLQIQM